MIRRLACAPAVLSIMLIGCGVGDAQQDLSGDTPIPAETTNDLTDAAAGQSVLIDELTSAGSSGAQAASPESAGDAGTDDGSADGGNGTSGNRADGGENGPMTADVLEELERTLDEIDRLLADLELDLEAD